MKILGDETRLPFSPAAPMKALGYETRFFMSCVDEGSGYETRFLFFLRR
jgi:hypothetical protein